VFTARYRRLDALITQWRRLSADLIVSQRGARPIQRSMVRYQIKM